MSGVTEQQFQQIQAKEDKSILAFINWINSESFKHNLQSDNNWDLEMFMGSTYREIGDLEAVLLHLEYKLEKQEEEIQQLREGYDRYEKVRKMNVSEFQEVFNRNVRNGEQFDDIVDGYDKANSTRRR